MPWLHVPTTVARQYSRWSYWLSTKRAGYSDPALLSRQSELATDTTPLLSTCSQGLKDCPFIVKSDKGINFCFTIIIHWLYILGKVATVLSAE